MAGLFLILLLPNFAFAHGMSEEEKLAIIEGGNLQYMWLGATHMLSGYDHLAFVFGIIFFLTNFRDIAKYVTAFTVGHSVTLIYATFNAIQLNYFLIDAVIALSVSYIAFSNLDGFRKYLGVKPPNMMVMILSLGLIHGFGLSTRLQELPLSEDDLLLNIISFNVGIEIGQISALVLMLLIIATFRKSHFFQTFSTITNYFLIIAGGLLFLMQMHGYEHTANSEEFTKSTATQQKEVDIQKAVNIKGSANNQLSEWKDKININIPARGDKEYKVFVKKGAAFDYSWESDSEELFYDFHGEPSGDTTGAFESFEKGTATKSNGSLITAFSGTHGWYWKNYSSNTVNITLKLNGEYQRKDILMDVKEKTPINKKNKPEHNSID
ncbi:MAG: HupE/UreJ family protein [Gammaproteobacteria bacterium]|nr:HupE/UreJ family protein [Gammaproteobacteria bacterium]